jgi:hypothetical protein
MVKTSPYFTLFAVINITYHQVTNYGKKLLFLLSQKRPTCVGSQDTNCREGRLLGGATNIQRI